MTAPISVDPSALASIGITVGDDGDATAAAVGVLSSGLSGAGAMFGHDAAGLVFAQGYTASGKAILDAAASVVNAGRRVGFGIETSAANYGHANASSTVGGGSAPVSAPSAPAKFTAPTMPPPLGDGIAAPLGWSLVESFVGDVWPDGNPGDMRAAAREWQSFAGKLTGLAAQFEAAGPGLGAQRIPESGQMTDALGKISSGLTAIAAEAQKLAASVDGFAATVAATQNAVRNLLHQLSPSGVLETIGGIFTGHDPLDEIRKIAHEIKTVLDNMKREADATTQMFSQGINILDSATDSLEKWANKEFTSVFGKEVGGALSFEFTAMVDGSEGALKFVAETAQGISQLDPTRFLYDPSGAAKTWEGLGEAAAVVTNPALLAEKVATDPQGSLDTVKGIVDWKDVEAGHLFRALGYDVAQVGSFFIPGAGEVDAAADGAGIAGRTASVEERLAAGAAREGVAGAASESVATQAGRVAKDLDGIKVPEGSAPVAAPGEGAPVGRPPVDVPAPSADAPGRAPVESPAPHPSSPEPSATEPVSPTAAEPAPPHSAEPAPHAESPTSPASVLGGESHTPMPSSVDHAPPRAAPESPSPSLPGGETHSSTPSAVDPPPSFAEGAPHPGVGQHEPVSEGRPVWSNHEDGLAADGSHDPDAVHDPSPPSDDHPSNPLEDGVGPDGRVKFSGHGSYSSVDGVTVIPEGSSVTVYAEHGSTITDGLGNLIETGGDTSRVFSHTYHAGESIPNYTLHPPEGLNIEGNPWTVDSSTRLSEMLKANMGEIDFAACLYDPAAPTNLLYDAQGIWDEASGQLTHVYESPETPGSWDDVIDEGENETQGGELQPYYDANQEIFGQTPQWDLSDIDLDEF